MAIRQPVVGDDGGRVHAFRVNLAIFVGVNVLLLAILAVLLLAGFRLGGELWPYPVVMTLWAIRVGIQGYRAYHGSAGR